MMLGMHGVLLGLGLETLTLFLSSVEWWLVRAALIGYFGQGCEFMGGL